MRCWTWAAHRIWMIRRLCNALDYSDQLYCESYPVSLVCTDERKDRVENELIFVRMRVHRGSDLLFDDFVVCFVDVGLTIPERQAAFILAIQFQQNSLDSFEFGRWDAGTALIADYWFWIEQSLRLVFGRWRFCVERLGYLPSGMSEKLWHNRHCHGSLSSGNVVINGMWQFWWNTFGHLSQHMSSPPSEHTAHQSSFGSSLSFNLSAKIAKIHSKCHRENCIYALTFAGGRRVRGTMHRRWIGLSSCRVRQHLDPIRI